MSDSHVENGKTQALNLLQQGQTDQARAVLERYCADNPQDAQAWFTLGLATVQLGQSEAAESCFRTAARLEPTKAVIHYNLGKTLQMMGRLAEAEASYREAIRFQPDLEAAHSNLGIVLLDGERAGEAVQCFQQALRIAPRLAEAHYNMGNALRRLGRLDEADESYRRALEIKPELAEAYESRGSLLLARGKFDEAIESYHAALDLRSDMLLAKCGLAAALKELGLGFRAEACYREVLQLDPEYIPAYMGLGRLFLDIGIFDAALENYQRALELDPDHASAAAETVVVLERMGRVSEAWEILQPLLQWEGRDRTVVALAYADVSRHVGRQAEALQMLKDVLGRADELRLSDRQRLLLYFAAGRLLDHVGSYDEAFECYRSGNQLYWADFSCKDLAETVTRHVAIFNEDFMRRAPRARHGSQRPVFIVGMPRSGTSLVEQILASHPDVYGAGEMEDINWMAISLPSTLASSKGYPDCVTEMTEEVCDRLAAQYLERLAAIAPEAALRVTDKMPGNYFHLGLIALLFPGARIVHCVRDPLDTCLSCYFQSFIQANNHQYAYNLEHLGCAYRQYRRLMGHWNAVLDLPIMEVAYGDLIRDQERVTRDLLAFCGLSWDERCMHFYESKRRVVTASYDQVRRPLYSSSIGRWRHYEKHLEPLRRALSED